MMLRCLALIILFLPVIASAQPINVRSGAHDGFTRLVLDACPGARWDIEKTASGARITIEDHTSGFNVSSIFDRIDRSYLSSVSSNEQSIFLEYTCECTAEVFSQGRSMIVIDISEVSEGQFSSPVTPASDLMYSFVGLQELSFDSLSIKSPNPNYSNISNSIKGNDHLYPNAQDAFLESEALSEIEINILSAAPLQEMQQNLADRFSRSATRGVLESSNIKINLPSIGVKPQIDISIFDSSTEFNYSTSADTPIGGNIRITSSLDISISSDIDFLTSTTLGIRCIDPELLAVQNWSSDIGFAPRVESLRSALYSEFDKVNPESAIQLAQTYLYFGFGAEAEQVLSVDSILKKIQ